MWWILFAAFILLVVVCGLIKSNQKPADPNCSECGGTGVKSEDGYSVWCDCTYKHKGGLI